MNAALQVGDRVTYARRVVQSEYESVQLGDKGTVIEVRDNLEADDDFGPVSIIVHIDGETKPGDMRHEAVFRPEELYLDLATEGAQALDDDGTEAESLAPVQAPILVDSFAAPADADYSTAGIPDVVLLDAAPIARWSDAGYASIDFGGAA